MRKRIIYSFILFIVVIVILILFLKANNYYKAIKVEGSIAKWSFKSKNGESVINLSNGKIAPGSKGQFEIEIDAKSSEVEVEYQIIVTEEKNIPHNMNFYAETKDEYGNIIDISEKYSSFVELASTNLLGNISVEKSNQKRLVVVFWEWPFNEEDTTLVDSNDAILNYDEGGNSSLKCGFIIEIVGKQSK